MSVYLEIFLEDKIYSQRTPNSKFIEFDLNDVKQKTYSELPEDIKEIANKMNEMNLNPESYFDYEEIEGGIKITGIYPAVGTHIRIPDYINDLPVIKIGGEILMAELPDIATQIQLPETINELSEKSFANAHKLKYINLPKNITKIPHHCFRHCFELSNLDFTNITEIGSYAFRDCAFKTLDLKSVTSIGGKAFELCRSLEKVILSNNIEELDSGTFSRCEKLNNVELPNSVKKLWCDVFSHCTSLRNIKFSKNLTEIMDFCFYGCESLTRFVAPESLKLIGEYAFSNSGLKIITLNSNLFARRDAFSDCEKIERIETPNPVKLSLQAFDTKDMTKVRVITKNHIINKSIIEEER